MWASLIKAIHWGLDLLYPRDCFFCQQPAGAHGHICTSCFERLMVARNPSCQICGAESHLPDGPDFICSDCLKKRPAFERAVVATRYDSAVRDLIHTFKYHQGLWLTEDLILFLQAAYLHAFVERGVKIDLLMPIPMLFKKERRRGYNQAELLVRALAREIKIPYTKRCLKRVKTKVFSQTQLGREGRLKNALASYRITHSDKVCGKTILLVDDVMTTGATLNACAQLLRDAGAANVYALALARGISR